MTPPPLPPVTNSPLSSCKRPSLALADKPPASPKLSLSPRLKHSPKTVSTFRRQAASPVLEQHYAATDICRVSPLGWKDRFGGCGGCVWPCPGLLQVKL